MNLFFSQYGGVIGGILGVVAFFSMIAVLKAIITVDFPSRLIVVTGKKTTRNGKSFGFSVERGRTLRVPYFQSVQHLELGVYPINVRVEGVNSANGITVGADATACVCIDGDDEAMLYSAVERLMGKGREQIYEQIQQTLVGNFRGALNKATPLEAIGMAETHEDEAMSPDVEGGDKGERAQFRAELFSDINSDLSSFGMKVVSVSLQKIWDTSNYIANLAQKTLAEKRQQVEIEEARLRALAAKAESDAEKRIKLAQSKANEAILSAQEKLEVYRRESIAEIERSTLQADHGIAEAENRGEQQIQAQLVDLQKLRNQSGVTIAAEAEEKAAQIIASGEQEAVEIVESARNEILRQKVKLLTESGDAGRSILFIQQQLPRLFESYKTFASDLNVDSMVVMDGDTGFSGAVNRGPSAFGDFIKNFKETLGVDVRGMIEPRGEAQ